MTKIWEDDIDDERLEDDSDDAVNVIADNGKHTPIGRALPAPPEEEHPSDESVSSISFNVEDPASVLNEVTVPQGVTHKPARSDCPDCSIAQRRNVRALAGASTTVAKQTYGDNLTTAHSKIMVGFCPIAIEGKPIHTLHQ